MSRLDSFIRRMTAQRDLLNASVAQIADVPGAIFELGLGNGRTFDHLRELYPDRDIRVFELEVRAHRSSVPTADQLILGDISQTLPQAVSAHTGSVALVHNDLGDGTAENHARIAAILEGALAPALAPGAVVISNMALKIARTDEMPLPAGIKPGRYFVYRNAAG